MRRIEGDIQTALTAIFSARLTPTEHLLLKDFVEGAVDPGRAARYVLQRIDNSKRSIEEELRCLKRDWRRLVSRRELLY